MEFYGVGNNSAAVPANWHNIAGSAGHGTIGLGIGTQWRTETPIQGGIIRGIHHYWLEQQAVHAATHAMGPEFTVKNSNENNIKFNNILFY